MKNMLNGLKKAFTVSFVMIVAVFTIGFTTNVVLADFTDGTFDNGQFPIYDQIFSKLITTWDSAKSAEFNLNNAFGTNFKVFSAIDADTLGGGLVKIVGNNVAITNKATSSSTIAADTATTLTTKDYVDSKVSGIGAGSSPWTTTTSKISYMNNVGIGTSTPNAKLQIVGKATSSSTIAADTATTLTTKDYVDTKVAGIGAGSSPWTTTTGQISYMNNVGIGTSTPTNKLEVVGRSSFEGGIRIGQKNWIAGWAVGIASPNSHSISIDSLETMITPGGIPDATMEVFYYNQGHIFNVNGTITTSSDKRLKKNIKTVSNALDKLLAIKGVSFDWKKNNKSSMGVIAQEVEPIFPALVNTDKKGYKSVNYNGFVGPIIEAIRELKNSVDTLIVRVDDLFTKYVGQKNEIASMHQEISILKARLDNLQIR